MNIRAHIPFELLFWMSAILLLGSMNVDQQALENHFTLCPLANLGFSWCPGCGLGRSIAQLLHGNLAESFKYHWFGLPALLIICGRMYSLGKQELNKRNKEKEKSYV